MQLVVVLLITDFFSNMRMIVEKFIRWSLCCSAEVM